MNKSTHDTSEVSDILSVILCQWYNGGLAKATIKIKQSGLTGRAGLCHGFFLHEKMKGKVKKKKKKPKKTGGL